MRLIVPATYALSRRMMNSKPSFETSVTNSEVEADILDNESSSMGGGKRRRDLGYSYLLIVFPEH